MIKEKDRLAIVNRTRKLVSRDSDMGIIMRDAAADTILALPDDYPVFRWNCKNWIQMVCRCNLWDFNRTIDDDVRGKLEMLIVYSELNRIDADKIDVGLVRDSVSAGSYGRNVQFFGRCLRGEWAQYLSKRMLLGENRGSFKDLLYLSRRLDSPKQIVEEADSSWIAGLFRNGIKGDYENYKSLVLFSSVERRLIDTLLDRSSAVSDPNRRDISVVATVFDRAEDSAALIDALDVTSETDGWRAASLVKYWLSSGKHSVLAAFLRYSEGMPLEELEVLDEYGFLRIISGNHFPNAVMRPQLLRMALRTKKSSFLKKVDRLCRDGVILGALHGLFEYEELPSLVNLNELSEDDIVKAEGEPCSRKTIRTLSNMLPFELVNGRKLTPKEVFMLLRKNSGLIPVYIGLGSLPTDEAVARYRELPDVSLESGDVSQLTACLLEKRFSAWFRDLSFIKGIKKQTVLECLSEWEYLKGYLPEISTVNDVRFLLENRGEGTLTEKRYVHLTSVESRNLLGSIGVDIGEAASFAEKGGLHIVSRYVGTGVGSSYIQNMYRIAKADILGKLHVLKYTSLDAEIGTILTPEIRDTWISNTSMRKGSYSVGEHDDFVSVMTIGENPVHTCQSYIDGSYKECLLSNFDANKKIIYIERDGVCLGRAILRLTRASAEKVDGDSTLEFMDVTRAESDAGSRPLTEVCLFLEKPYIARKVSEEESVALLSVMQELAREKASKMGVSLYCNERYSGEDVLMYIYVSRSKNGKQYLDSLTGCTSLHDEAAFYRAHVKK